MKQTHRYCPQCRRNVLATGHSPNHTLHVVLSIFTCGFWLLIWPLVAAGSIGGYRCSRCGNEDLMKPRGQHDYDDDDDDEEEDDRPRRNRRRRDDDDD